MKIAEIKCAEKAQRMAPWDDPRAPVGKDALVIECPEEYENYLRMLGMQGAG